MQNIAVAMLLLDSYFYISNKERKTLKSPTYSFAVHGDFFTPNMLYVNVKVSMTARYQRHLLSCKLSQGHFMAAFGQYSLETHSFYKL